MGLRGPAASELRELLDEEQGELPEPTEVRATRCRKPPQNPA